MPQARVHSLNIEYEVLGEVNAPAILLIMGAGGQLTFWPDALCQGLVDAGYRVVRYDHRDCGLSSKLDELGTPNRFALMICMLLRLRVRAPYGVDDLAGDALGLLDALGVPQAHVVGASMGGMIAQILAIRAPERVLSLTSIMSTAGNRGSIRPRPDVLRLMRRSPPKRHETDRAIEHLTEIFSKTSGLSSPEDLKDLKSIIAKSVRRSYTPEGQARHAAAVLAAPDRRADLRSIQIPTLVIHGADDPVIPVESGRETARNIPGATLKVIEGMGHGLPVHVVPIVLEAILAHTRSAEAPRATLSAG